MLGATAYGRMLLYLTGGVISKLRQKNVSWQSPLPMLNTQVDVLFVCYDLTNMLDASEHSVLCSLSFDFQIIRSFILWQTAR